MNGASIDFLTSAAVLHGELKRELIAAGIVLSIVIGFNTYNGLTKNILNNSAGVTVH
jgi:hypothetical protein